MFVVGIVVQLDGSGNHPKTGLLGVRGQRESIWSSCRRNEHLEIALALPVNTSLYSPDFQPTSLGLCKLRPLFDSGVVVSFHSYNGCVIG